VEAARDRATDRGVRELLALQASDWAFLVTRGSAGDYPGARADAHADELARALSDGGGEQALRGLAPDLTRRLY
jgi:1,4-alpha-glucan branching enzyme